VKKEIYHILVGHFGAWIIYPNRQYVHYIRRKYGTRPREEWCPSFANIYINISS